MKLFEQLAAACRTMNFAKSPEECYSAWVEDSLRFHKRRAGKWVHPDGLREEAIEAFLTHLAVERKLAASSQSQAMCALVFFYREVLGQPFGRISAFRAKRPERLPIPEKCLAPPRQCLRRVCHSKRSRCTSNVFVGDSPNVN